MENKKFKNVTLDEAFELAKQNKKVFAHRMSDTGAISTRNIRSISVGKLLDHRDEFMFQVLEDDESVEQ